MKWESINTAPKTGKYILLYKGGDISMGRWQKDVIREKKVWGGRGWSYAEWSQPTHWMPLPPKPLTK